GLAVTTVVVHPHRIPGTGERARKTLVPAGVLGHAVGRLHDRLGLAVGQPGPDEQRDRVLRGGEGGRVASHAGRRPARAGRELPDVGASMVTHFAHPLTPEGPMSKKSAKKLTAREARLAEAREQQRATERRRAMLLTVATGLVIAVIVGAVAWAIVGEKDEREA